MSATITLPADLETIAVTRATERGMTLQQFAEDAIRKVSELTDPWDLFADVREEVAQQGLTEEQLEAEINEAIQEVRARSS